jgi:hypothetical protein
MTDKGISSFPAAAWAISLFPDIDEASHQVREDQSLSQEEKDEKLRDPRSEVRSRFGTSPCDPPVGQSILAL